MSIAEDESRDGATGGARLGLSIARRAVPLHHSEITAENASPGLRMNIIIPGALGYIFGRNLAKLEHYIE